ncbi:glycoside hydrolase family 43 protein [Longimicrobium terrae]|uniref:Alpha-N-arabinofuranosidase n=1 Tax=Longimicrobium terrae TaxID=1639882 RepID=A0A841H3S1_9BACT|nr:glycoside hydrolase family 43 protein [Longimicrobium terrae]MBB4638470.1 alpha-N-arabinofuranosidase [Longimicrobium terrae]MBB6072687.1 alpha-N-arabinofuranosidase [Longimicrobium terrae]NNC32439.1 glycoside hydrolase family 43 protein [Longimicrobium terrae]
MRAPSALRPLALLLPLAAACATAQPEPATAQPSDARFEWFEYMGDDPAFRQNRAGANEYLNPVLAGFYPDPSIARAGDDYYMVTSSFAYFPGVPLFHSRDLVNWTQIGHVLSRPSQLNLDSAGISRGIFAPVIRYNAGTFYMITTIVDRGGNFIVTATDPRGPWSDPVFLPEVDGIDPSIFFDDNGKAYIVNNGPPIGAPLYEGHRAIWMQEFDAASQRMTGPRRLIVNGGVDLARKPIWIEAPHILKVDGRYYLICAEGGTAEQHSEVVFRADSPWGPWIPWTENPILTQRHLDPARPLPITTTGHADFVRTPRGEWWAVFLGVRPYRGDHYNNGRETYLLPVRWTEDGWPEILRGDATVPYAGRRPDLPAQPAPPIPMTGNFTHRDEFDGAALAPEWVFIRTPREHWHALSSGALVLRPRAAVLGDVGAQPSFVGRRQQHAYGSASTAVRYTPRAEGDRAGLAAFHDDKHFYLLSVARRDGRPVVQLEQRSGDAPATVIASAPLTVPADGPVYLKVEARGDGYAFSYGTRPGEWAVLKDDADGTVLSTKVAGGFVGTMLGMYAHSASDSAR